MTLEPVGLDAALAAIRSGRSVAYPTETVYGLGADAHSASAIARLLAWKGRAAAQPLTILVHGAAGLEPLGVALDAPARALMEAFWPGPLTLVVPATCRFAPGVGRADGALGVRCASHPLARALAAHLAREGVVITATSLNRSGETPARTCREARAACGEGAAAPLLLRDDTLPEPSGAPSSILDLTTSPPTLLRVGAIERAALERVLGPLAEAPESHA